MSLVRREIAEFHELGGNRVVVVARSLGCFFAHRCQANLLDHLLQLLARHEPAGEGRIAKQAQVGHRTRTRGARAWTRINRPASLSSVYDSRIEYQLDRGSSRGSFGRGRW